MAQLNWPLFFNAIVQVRTGLSVCRYCSADTQQITWVSLFTGNAWENYWNFSMSPCWNS